LVGTVLGGSATPLLAQAAPSPEQQQPAPQQPAQPQPAQQQARIEVHIALAYFNSSSTKMLFNLIEALSGAAEAGRPVALHWYHDEEDDTICEFGEELRDDFPAIAFTGHPVKAA
jgi:hypothetical protein